MYDHTRLAGLLVPAFALRAQENDLGIGDTQAVKEAIDFCHQNYFGVLQLLPINETGGDNSPYNAISAIALDPVYIHLSPSAANLIPGLEATDFQSHYDADIMVVDYLKVKAFKKKLLEKAFLNFENGNCTNYENFKNDFDLFKKQNKAWLEDYSLFRSLVDTFEGNICWTQWGKLSDFAYASRWINEPDQKNTKRLCTFYSFVQWLVSNQWSSVKEYADSKNVKLIGDIPFGVSRYSADVWANKHLFELNWSGGAPPESFFQADKFTKVWGQNWGIPLYNWTAHENENYAWWNLRVEQTNKYFHGFRIDHVLGFFRIYAFPWLPEENDKYTDLTKEEACHLAGDLPGFKPRDDEQEDNALLNCQQGTARLKIILKAAANNIVIAEDLGTVPKYVRPTLQQLGIPGFSIPVFERDEKDRSFKAAKDLPALNLITYGTHDNEPIASFYQKIVQWWHSDDGHNGWLEIQRLMRFLNLDETNPPKVFTDELACAFFETLFSAPCWLSVLMITDLLGTSQRFNLPGTSSHSNWSERLAKPLSQYIYDDKFVRKISCARQLILKSNRQPQPLSRSNLSSAIANNG